jgi:hypothetical protein
MVAFAKGAAAEGFKVIVRRGRSGAPAGMTASLTTLPVLRVPVPVANMAGLDSLLSIVQMPLRCRWEPWPWNAGAKERVAAGGPDPGRCQTRRWRALASAGGADGRGGPRLSRAPDDAAAAGSTIGIVGGGQLGRMLALAAARLGFDVAVLDPEADCPAGRVAARLIVGGYADTEALEALAQASAVVTTEFENAPAEPLRRLVELGYSVAPNPDALATAQDRVVEKTFPEPGRRADRGLRDHRRGRGHRAGAEAAGRAGAAEDAARGLRRQGAALGGGA